MMKMKRTTTFLALLLALLPATAWAAGGTWIMQLTHDPWVDHIWTSVLIVVLLTAMSAVVGGSIKASLASGDMVPAPRFSLRNLVEVALEGVTGMMQGILGDDWKRFLPIIGTLAVYIFVCNIIGLIPGFLPPTSDINTTASMAIPVFLLTHYYGIRAHGLVAYLKHFAGPMLALAPLIFLIEMIGHVARPISLSLRLFGNITGDHEVVGRFGDLVAIGVPVPFMLFGILVCFIQTFVFILLSMIYFSLAVAHDEGHGHGEDHGKHH